MLVRSGPLGVEPVGNVQMRPEFRDVERFAVSANGKFMVTTCNRVKARVYSVITRFDEVTFHEMREIDISENVHGCYIDNKGVPFFRFWEEIVCYPFDSIKVTRTYGALTPITTHAMSWDCKRFAYHYYGIIRIRQNCSEAFEPAKDIGFVHSMTFCGDTLLVCGTIHDGIDRIGGVYLQTSGDFKLIVRDEAARVVVGSPSGDKFLINREDCILVYELCGSEWVEVLNWPKTREVFTAVFSIGSRYVIAVEAGAVARINIKTAACNRTRIGFDPLFAVGVFDVHENGVCVAILYFRFHASTEGALGLLGGLLRALPFELQIRVCMAVCGATSPPLPTHFEEAKYLLAC